MTSLHTAAGQRAQSHLKDEQEVPEDRQRERETWESEWPFTRRTTSVVFRRNQTVRWQITDQQRPPAAQRLVLRFSVNDLKRLSKHEALCGFQPDDADEREAENILNILIYPSPPLLCFSLPLPSSLTLSAFLEKAGGLFLCEPGDVPAVM